MEVRTKLVTLAVATAIAFICCQLFMNRSAADTVTTQGGKEIKGIVVEEYKDRIVLSTVDGEMTMMKSDIWDISLDSEEDNLIRRAQQAMDRRDQETAFTYYTKALRLNPGARAAKQGLAYLQSYSIRMKEAEKVADIKRREDLERYGSIVTKIKSEEDENLETLENSTGMTISIKDDFPYMEKVKINSPAYKAGVRKGDRLVAIWGKLTGYLSLNEVLNLLLRRSAIEMRCTIERTIEVPANSATFSMEIDGLTVASVIDAGSGLKDRDLITSINGDPTRYTPLKSAVETIRKSETGYVKVTLQRNIIIWRGSET